MRKLTILTYLLVLFSACSTEELDFATHESALIIEKPLVDKSIPAQPEADPVEILTSKALRTALVAISENLISTKASVQRNKTNEAITLCFQFVYPLVVRYNDGSTQQLNDYDTLLQVLLDESSTLHLDGIGFPFEVKEEGSEDTTTIKDEQEFKMLLSACGYEEINYSDVINAVSSCFTVTYPLDLIVNDHIKTFMTQQETENYFNQYWSSSVTVSISYPFRVTLHTMEEDKRTSIENDFEMINLIKNSCKIN